MLRDWFHIACEDAERLLRVEDVLRVTEAMVDEDPGIQLTLRDGTVVKSAKYDVRGFAQLVLTGKLLP